MRLPLVVLFTITLIPAIGCNRKAVVADASMVPPVAGMPALSGKLYVSGDHLRVDWGLFADVFDLKQRKGWRIFAEGKTYEELSSKDLSTYAPEMTGGSICPHAQVPSGCKLVGSEIVEGRSAKKWDVYNPNGWHVYFWTDDATLVTLRMDMGDVTTYSVHNVKESSISASTFELPAGYSKMVRR